MARAKKAPVEEAKKPLPAPTGRKAGFIPAPGQEASPAVPADRRYAERRARAEEARVAAEARVRRGKLDVSERVDKAIDIVRGRTQDDVVNIIRLASPYEQDVYLVAEELANGGRRDVMGSFSPYKQAVMDAYKLTHSKAGSTTAASPSDDILGK